MSKAANIDGCACAPCCSFRQTGQIDINCSGDVCRGGDWMVRGEKVKNTDGSVR